MTAPARLAVALLRAEPGRARMMIAAVALAVAAVGAIVGAQTVIDREIDRAFAQTLPPAAVIGIAGGGEARAADIARSVPGVTAAQARAEHRLRLEGAEGWQQVILIAVDDPAAADVGRAFPEPPGAAWPPGPGQIAVERSSLAEVDVAVGDEFTLVGVSADGQVEVSSLSYDPGRTPAWLNGWVVAYTAPATLNSLGLGSEPNRLLVSTGELGREANRAIAEQVVAALAAEGIEADVLDVPVPGVHPAAGVMSTLLFVLQAFGAVAVLAAAALLVAVVTADVRRRLPMIGVLKTQGATSRAIAAVFLRGVAIVAGLGLLVALPLGAAGTWALAAFALTLLNISAESWVAAPWVFGLQAVIASVVPVVAVGVPVALLTRIRAREALAVDGSVAAGSRAGRRGTPRLGRGIQLGWRNATRQPVRLGTSLAALGVGVAAVISALNTGAAWNAAVEAEFEAQDYAVQVVLPRPVEAGVLTDALGPGAEAWLVGEAPARPEGGPAGDTVAVAVPPQGWANPGYAVLDGRWLEPGAREAVLTQSLTDPALEVGSPVLFGADPDPYVVVGVVRQLTGGEAGTAYLNARPSWMPQGSVANAGRIPNAAGASDVAMVEVANQRLDSAGIPVTAIVTATDAREALDDHLYIITGLLLVLAMLLAVVGLVALVEALTTGVLERRAEFAVAKVLGAGLSTVTRMVVVEAAAVAFLAWAVGGLLAVPATAAFESAIGTTFVGAPLPFTWWWPGCAIALVVMLAAAVAASVAPAFDAADTPVREALAGE